MAPDVVEAVRVVGQGPLRFPDGRAAGGVVAAGLLVGLAFAVGGVFVPLRPGRGTLAVPRQDTQHIEVRVVGGPVEVLAVAFLPVRRVLVDGDLHQVVDILRAPDV